MRATAAHPRGHASAAAQASHTDVLTPCPPEYTRKKGKEKEEENGQGGLERGTITLEQALALELRYSSYALPN